MIARPDPKYKYILVYVLAALFLAVAMAPDAKIVRLKLQILENGALAVFLTWALSVLGVGALYIRKSPLNGAVLAYTAVFAAFYAFTPDKHIARQEFGRVLLCAGLFFPIANSFFEIGHIKKTVFFISMSAAVAALYGILQAFGGARIVVLLSAWHCAWAVFFVYAYWGKVKLKGAVIVYAVLSAGVHIITSLYNISKIDIPFSERPISTFGNPIFFAAFLILIIPIALSAGVAAKNRILKFLAFGSVLIMASAVLLSKTRAAWLGLAAGMVLWYILWEMSNDWRVMRFAAGKKKLIAAFLILAVAGHFSLSISVPAYTSKINQIGGYFNAIISRHQAHTLIWRDTVKMAVDNPFTGVGLGSFHTNFPNYASDELKAVWPQGKFIVNDAHNEYLQILAETGLAGFGVFGLFIFFLYRVIFKIRRKAGPEERMYLAGFAGGITALLVQNFFSVDMRFAVSAAYLFTVAALAVSLDGRRLCAYFDKHIFVRLVLAAAVIAGGIYAFKIINKPYKAFYQLRQEKNFFDEKVLEPAKTIDELQRLLEKHPDQPKIHEKLGWVYAKDKNWQMAIKHYERAKELDPGLIGAYNNLGNIYFHLNNKDKAIEFYKQAVSKDPNIIDAWLNMGIAYYNKGMLKESARSLKEALRIDPNNPKAIAAMKRMSE